MGYTHYWNGAGFHEDEWRAFALECRYIVSVAQDELGIALAAEYDRNAPPIIDENEVVFNGYGDENGHETFFILKDSRGSNFCKTAMKPYDAVVVACLRAADRINPQFSWSSDGDGYADQLTGAIEIESLVNKRKQLNG